MPHPGKSLVLSALLGLLAGVALAQTAPVPPPPDIDDPGVAPAASALAPTLPVPLRDVKAPRVPADAPVHVVPAPASTALPPEATPDVEVHNRNGDRVEEYRRNGKLYMVRVIPKHGVPQTYLDNDGDGRLDRDSKSGAAVAPVNYTLYQWGKAPKPAAASSAP